MQNQKDTIDALFKVGAHFGYSKTRRHSSAKKFIFGTKNKVDIIDLEKTYVMLEDAKKVMRDLKAGGKTILFVGTKPEAREIIRSTASSLGMPYVADRWVGGLITNFPEVKKRIAYFEEIRTKKEKGELDMFTKKERLLIEKDLERMTHNFGGVSNIKRVPDAMFVVDPKKEHIAVTEAIKSGIPVVAIANTDCNLKAVNFPILANDGSRGSIEYIVNTLKEALID